MILDQYDTFIDKGFQIFKDSFPENKPTKTVFSIQQVCWLDGELQDWGTVMHLLCFHSWNFYKAQR
jgi:hypothetical protein